MNGMARVLYAWIALGAVMAMLLVVACGGSAPAASDATTGPEAPASTEVGAVARTEVGAVARSETGGLGQIMEKAKLGEIVSVVIDDCSWGPPEGGGAGDLKLIVSSRQLGEQHRVVKEEVPLDNCIQP